MTFNPPPPPLPSPLQAPEHLGVSGVRWHQGGHGDVEPHQHGSELLCVSYDGRTRPEPQLQLQQDQLLLPGPELWTELHLHRHGPQQRVHERAQLPHGATHRY